MRTRLAAFLSIASLALLATTATAQGKPRECADGTTSTAGRGACSGHGGLKKATKTASKAAAKDAKTETKAATKAAKTETKAAAKVAKTDAKAEKKETKAATVKCVDGTSSKGGQGACSGHGGVKG